MTTYTNMIKRYKNISIAKISDHGGTANTPTHAIVVSDDKYQNKKTVGKLWTKTSTNGKFLAGVMANPYVGKSKVTGLDVDYTGWCIVAEDELNELMAIVNGKRLLTSPEPKVEEEINLGDIPF